MMHHRTTLVEDYPPIRSRKKNTISNGGDRLVHSAKRVGDVIARLESPQSSQSIVIRFMGEILAAGMYVWLLWQFVGFSMFARSARCTVASVLWPPLAWMFPSALEPCPNLAITLDGDGHLRTTVHLGGLDNPNINGGAAASASASSSASSTWTGVATMPITDELVANVLLSLLFALPHSLLARSRIQQQIRQQVGPVIERLLFLMLSGLSLQLMYSLFRPIANIVVWNFDPIVVGLPSSALFAYAWNPSLASNTVNAAANAAANSAAANSAAATGAASFISSAAAATAAASTHVTPNAIIFSLPSDVLTYMLNLAFATSLVFMCYAVASSWNADTFRFREAFIGSPDRFVFSYYPAPSFAERLVHNPVFAASLTSLFAAPTMRLGHFSLAVIMFVYTKLANRHVMKQVVETAVEQIDETAHDASQLASNLMNATAIGIMQQAEKMAPMTGDQEIPVVAEQEDE